jgi:hypothetical protein
VSGWWLPIRIWCAVMPGADAVAAPEDDGEELQAAAIIAAAAPAATKASGRTRCDLFM